MNVDFCKQCDNLLYLYEDPESKKIVNVCKACGSTEEKEDSVITVNSDSKITLDKSDVLAHNPYICQDITLPTIQGNKNLQCKNKQCPAEESTIYYIKYDPDNMKYLYICKDCGTKWKNNL